MINKEFISNVALFLLTKYVLPQAKKVTNAQTRD